MTLQLSPRVRARAARRVRWAHLDPRPLTLDRTLARLLDVVTAHDLPRWRVDTWGGDDGQTWASVGWESPWGPIAVGEPHGRMAARRIHIRVGRILRAQDEALITTARLKESRP